MALFVAAKFSPFEMPVIYDPGIFQDLKTEEFILVPRSGSEDIAFIAALEYKSVHQLKLRRDPFPKVMRRATTEEVEQWKVRKKVEKEALILAKEKSRALNLDIKISHTRIDYKENKTTFHFTSDQRVDFRALVKELSAILKMRIELWQIGVRDEARMLDGYGVCGQQTCCSGWITDFKPITIRMAKDQDINLPPTKLSGQCGRLLCCLSYEVDQYKLMNKEALPKGAKITWNDRPMMISDRNLVAGTYVLIEQTGAHHTVKHSDLIKTDEPPEVPEQMKNFGKKVFHENPEEVKKIAHYSPPPKSIPQPPVELAPQPKPDPEPVKPVTIEKEPEVPPSSRRPRKGQRRPRVAAPPSSQESHTKKTPPSPEKTDLDQGGETKGKKSRSSRRHSKRVRRPESGLIALPNEEKNEPKPGKAPDTKPENSDGNDPPKQTHRKKKRRRR
jgi:cell fate regulator YaaT (PSP1 superfamily)